MTPAELSTMTLRVGMTAIAWTDFSEDDEPVLRVEAHITVLAIKDDYVTLVIEQKEMEPAQ